MKQEVCSSTYLFVSSEFVSTVLVTWHFIPPEWWQLCVIIYQNLLNEKTNVNFRKIVACEKTNEIVCYSPTKHFIDTYSKYVLDKCKCGSGVIIVLIGLVQPAWLLRGRVAGVARVEGESQRSLGQGHPTPSLYSAIIPISYRL